MTFGGIGPATLVVVFGPGLGGTWHVQREGPSNLSHRHIAQQGLRERVRFRVTVMLRFQV